MDLWRNFCRSKLLTCIIRLMTFALARLRRQQRLQILYLVVVASGFTMILYLNYLLTAKQVESTEILTVLLNHHIGEMDRSCVTMMSQNKDTVGRIRRSIQQFPPHQSRQIELFLAKEFKPCIKESAKRVIRDPNCFMHKRLLRQGLGINLKIPPPNMADIENKYQDVLEEGFYRGPASCVRSEHSTLIILPYRDRELHLRYWLHYTIDALITQKLRFQIIVVEQEEGTIFNKGQLMNTAFQWALENTEYRWNCVVFHDVDMITELYGTLYRCKGHKKVIHFARYIDKFNYTINGKIGVTVGGAVGFTEHQYQLVNGYSNVYWGWGGEDDDMYARIRKMSLKLIRYKKPYGRYKMIRHKRDEGNPKNVVRHQLLKGAIGRMHEDGLSSLDTKILLIERRILYIRLLVEVNEKNFINVTTTQQTNITTRPRISRP